ncbi:Trk system potassium transporter TrkA [soil metagenome]
MNIIILGAGRVGESVARSLVSERNDITVIDTNAQRLRELQERLDLRGVTGNGIHPSILREAGAEDADMLIACASMDETNLVVCKVANDVFNVTTTIARIRSPEYPEGSQLLGPSGFAIDQVICPEESITRYIRKLIEFPEALQVLQFARGLASLIAVRAVDGGAMVEHAICELPQLVPNADMRVVAIYRLDSFGNDRQIECDGDTRIEPGDEVFVLAATKDIRQVLDSLRRRDPPVKRVLIAGGGHVGLRLARQIQHEFQVKVIESSPVRADYLTTQLSADTLILHGDATDGELLHAEGIRDTDLFLALTSDDEDNIMSCLLAKRMGAKRVLALVNRREYADLVQGTAIDIALSPAEAIIGELLLHVRRGDVQAVFSLRRGESEALEAVVRGDRKSSKLVGRRIDEIKMPEGVQFGAIVRGGDLGPGEQDARDAETQVIIAHGDTQLESGDHVIVFLPRKRMVRQVEKLFEVNAAFF